MAALGGYWWLGYLAVRNQVYDVRTAFGHLVDVRALQAVLAQPGGGAAGGHQRPAALDQFARNRQHARLVRVAHGDERLADRRRAGAVGILSAPDRRTDESRAGNECGRNGRVRW